MTLEQFIAAAERATFDAKTMADLDASMKLSDEKFDRLAREHAITEEVLSRVCSL